MFHSHTSSPLRKIGATLFPPLSYGLSRDIEVSWLAPLAYACSFVAVIGLIVLNVALTTYDVIDTTTEDFNATQTLWYHRFTGPPAPGSQCSTYNLTVGQQFTTTPKLMTYTLLKIGGDKRILPYSGIPLQRCDVISAAVDVDVVATTVTNIVYIACNTTDLQITAKTEYVWSNLPSLEDSGPGSPGQTFFAPNTSLPGGIVSYVFDTACQNLKALVQSFPIPGSTDTPGRISIQGIPSCSQHPTYSRYASTYCQDDDSVPVTWLYGGGQLESYFGFANGTEFPIPHAHPPSSKGKNWVNLGIMYDSASTVQGDISGIYLPAITDVLQMMISVVRLDFGHTLPNNPLLNMTAMNQTLEKPFPGNIETLADATWNMTLQEFSDPMSFAAFEAAGFLQGNSSYINGEYQCRFWYPIGWAQATVNVMVATLSLFTSGWSLAMVVLAFIMTRTPENNYCIGHAPTSAIAEKTVPRDSSSSSAADMV